MKIIKADNKTLIENNIQYIVYMDGEPCCETCNSDVPCTKCKRLKLEGVAKIPSGKQLLTD